MLADISRLRSQLASTQRDEGDRQLLLEDRLKKLETAVFKKTADDGFEQDKLHAKIEQLETRLEEIQAAKPVVEQPAATPSLSKTDQFAAIKTAHENKEYEKTVAGCDTYLAKYPDDKQFTAQVLFWKGDAYFELGEYKKAVLSFQELLTKFQTFSKVPEALYKVGVSLENLKFPKDAVVFYEEIVSKHAKSPFAAKAKEHLKKKKK